MSIFRRMLVIVFILSLIGAVSGCGVSNTSSIGENTYKLPKGNHVILGPIENATISIYKLTDTKTSILTTQSGKLGTFKVSLPDSVSDSDLLLVEAKSGVDIDYNDDGLKDSNPTKNDGILHCICKAKDLKSGTVNITILSDIVYQYTKHLIPEIGEKLSEDDFWMILNTVSSQLVKSQDKLDVEPYHYVLAFNPVIQKNILSFDYSKLYKDGQNSLMYIYHTNNEESKRLLLESFFKEKGLLLDDYRYENLRKNVKLTISYPESLISSISIEGSDIEGNNISKNLTHTESFFIPKGTKLKISVINLNSSYKILKWYGCDYTSDDLNECYVNIQNDRVVTPIVVPNSVELSDNVTVVDITGAYIELSNSTDSAENPALIPVNSPLLDHITVYADLSDTKMKSILASIKEGNIIVNKTFPVFFRKVVKVEKITDYRYKVDTKFVPLTEIVKQGYISTSVEGLSGGSGSEKKVLRALILPNGKVIPFDPNKSKGILINFSNGTMSVSVLPESKAIDWSETEKESYGPIYIVKLDDDNYASLSGSLTITPSVHFDMSWEIGWSGVHINQVNTKVGTNLEVDDTLEIKLKKEFGKRIPIFKKPITYSQVFMVGPIPVLLSEKLYFYCGIKGAGKGEEEDQASIEGSASFTTNAGIDSEFTLSYNGDTGNVVTNFEVTPHMSIEEDVKAAASVFGYVGVQPEIEVYGLGIGMENDIGPYVRASFEATASSWESATVSGEEISSVSHGTSTDSITANATVGNSTSIRVSGKVGLGYYGRIKLVSDWDIDWIKHLIEKANEKIRGKYTEFWYEWPWKEIDITFNSTSETTIGASETHAIKPGKIEVEGENVVIEEQEGDSLSKSVVYTIRNSGDTSIYWKAEVIAPPDISVVIPKKTGELEGNASVDVPIELSGANLHEGTYHILIQFYQSESPFSESLWVDPSSFSILHLLSSSLPVSSKSIDIKVIPPSWNADFNANLVGTTAKKIQFHWEKYPGTINGYVIVYSSYDSENSTCDSENMKSLVNIASVNDTKYEILLDQAVKNGQLSYGKSYCFLIYALKSVGDSKPIYIPSSDTKLAIVEIANNTSGTSGKEVDIDFLVDRTGSYGDDISTFQAKAKEIVQTLLSSMPEGTILKVGITSFKDFPPPEGYGDLGDYPFKLELDLTNDTSQFISVINTLTAGGGGDYPESQLEALYQSVKQLSWNPAAIKIILLFTDASFHDPDVESYPGHGFKEVKNLLVSNNFAVIGMASGYASEDLKNISNYLFTLSSDSGEVVEKIKELMLSIPGTSLPVVTKRSITVIEPKEVKVLPKSIWKGEPNSN